MKGRIHSTETFGTVDGPGVRYVVFFQGCPMRCQYCHNPDTWEIHGGNERSVEELLSEYEKNKGFYKGGGITATGGESMLQLDFLIQLFEEAKRRGIHTCLDTSGVTHNPGNSIFLEKLDRLLAVTDLVMLDLKHIDPAAHIKLTAMSNEKILEFAKYLDQKEKSIWIRHVVVPTITDQKDFLFRLGQFIGALKHIKALDVLPYHSMGITKYQDLGMEYPLKDLPDLEKEAAVEAKKIILDGIRDIRKI